jgi:tetratricopeptide (TPR) repeat protein
MPDNLTLPETLRRAYSAFNAGRFGEVEVICQRIVDAQPDHFDALHLLAIAQSRLGKTSVALANFDRALSVQPDSAEALCNRGIALHRLGRLDEAVAAFDRAIVIRPDFALPLSNRGVVLHDLKRYQEAVAAYDRALAAQPDLAEAHSNRGNSLQALKRYEEAVASYDRALAARPDYAAALANRGNALCAMHRFDEALASYDRALALATNDPEVPFNRGNALHEMERFDEALASYDRALAMRPHYAEALTNRGNTLQKLGRMAEALASHDRALALQPAYLPALSNRGGVLREMRRFEEALASYDRALANEPDHAEILINRGNVLQNLRRFEEALASYDRALALRSDHVSALSNRGGALYGMGRLDDAMASLDQALTIKPDHAEALISRGNFLTNLKRFDEAVVSYRRAFASERHAAEAHFSESLCRLLTGDFERGLEQYEWRWETPRGRKDKRDFTQPLWLGADDISGKTVLLHAEQGLGDTLQFCRYAPLIAARGARVILEVQEPLRTLMDNLDGPETIIARGEPLPAFDVHCPLLSLPLAFQTRLETIPAAVPYLRASPQAIADWRQRLGRAGRMRRPAVGLAWSGLSTGSTSYSRSVPLRALLPLLDADATFVSLQKEVPAEDMALLNERTDIRHFGAELRDFSDTAALVTNLDLVISIDTSVAHLAGALGRPVWVLLPYDADWRWLLDRADSPWYPTARLFRQAETRDWDPVITRLCEALEPFRF